MAPGRACGALRRNALDLAPQAMVGDVLVAERAVPDDVGRILSAAATLTLEATFLSHVSLLSREFGKPSVSLGVGSVVEIVAGADSPALLRLVDVVGAEDGPVLDEGDLVLVDGDQGTVAIPGGVSAETRRRIREVHAVLVAYARHPSSAHLLDALVRAVAEEGDLGSAYALEAALTYRLAPRGEPTRRLLTALGERTGAAEAVGARVAAIRRRLQGEIERRCREAVEAIDLASDLDELERTLRAFEARLGPEFALLDDLAMESDEVEPGLDTVLAAADRRRKSLRSRLEDEVDAALGLPPEGLRPALGGLFRTLRRARAARLEPKKVERLHARLSQTLAEERRRSGVHLVVRLGPDARRDRTLIGGKAAGLVDVAGLLPGGCRVPAGFVVTTAAYRLHLLGETGERLRLAVADGGDEGTVSRRARAAILGGEIPREVADAVAQAAAALGSSRLAVRSSATVEDRSTSSLAGLFDTYLGVRGLEETLERIRWSWASLWNARALVALAAAGLSPLRASIAVLVQEIVPTRAAGVLLSSDPGGRPDTLVVNAAWGLGEAVSQGEVAGDLFWVKRSVGATLATELGGSNRKVVLDPSGPGTIDAPLSSEEAKRPCLDADDLARLAELARALERGTGRAQDVEFGFSPEGDLVVFQIRRVVPSRSH